MQWRVYQENVQSVHPGGHSAVLFDPADQLSHAQEIHESPFFAMAAKHGSG